MALSPLFFNKKTAIAVFFISMLEYENHTFLGKKVEVFSVLWQYSKVNTKIDLNYCIEEGLKYGLLLIAKEYKNVNDKMI